MPLFLAMMLAVISSTSSASEASIGEMLDLPLGEVRQLSFEATSAEKRKLAVFAALIAARNLPVPEAQQFVHEADAEAVRSQLGDGWYWALIAMDGWLKARISQLDVASNQCNAALDEIESIEEHAFRGYVYSCVAFIAIRRGDLAQALEYQQQSVIESGEGGSFKQYTGALSNEALVLYYLRSYDTSIKRFEQLLSMEDRLDLTLSRIVRFNLGLVYLDVGELEKALSAFEEGIAWTRDSGQRHRQLIAHTFHAKALIALDRPADAIATLAPWIDNPDIELDQDSVTNALLTSASAQLAADEPTRALTQSMAGLKLANSMRVGPLTLVYVKSLRALGREQEALSVIVEGINTARSTQDKTLADMLNEGAELFAAAGKFPEAYRALDERMTITRASNEADLARQYATLESIHALEKTRKEMKLLEANAARESAEAEQQYLTSIVILTGILMVVIIAFFIRERLAQRREIVRSKTEAERLETIVASRTRDLEARIVEVMEQRSELVELQKQLDDADKMRAIGTLTGGVAHDFNNLLTVILGSTSLLESQPDLPLKDREDLLKAIATAGETGAKITASLLSYARRQPLNPRQLAVNTCLGNSRLLLEKAVAPQGRLEINLEPGFCKLDEGAFLTAIMNLLINAADASDHGATIRLTGKVNRSDGLYQLEVIDQGLGMTPLELERVFEPFYSTKTSTMATGLGLSMAHGFAHQSGGTIAIDSQPGKGTTVRLELPLLAEAELSEKAVESKRIQNESMNVVCVDDNVTILRTMVCLLESLGHEVRGFTDGEAALASMRKSAADLLLSDVLMPDGISGQKLAEIVQGEFPGTRILLVSGFAEATQTKHQLLRKPFFLDELRNAIDSMEFTKSDLH